MNQKTAQAIIKKTYGEKAIALGHSVNGQEVNIFWIYTDESEESYKVHPVTIQKETEEKKNPASWLDDQARIFGKAFPIITK